MMMAERGRHDHSLMRQRGIGVRTIMDADSGPSVGLGASRLERQQMRQRGAGTRIIKATDFGIAFPTPSASGGSTTRSSRQSSSKDRRPSRTPSVNARALSSPRSLRNNSTISKKAREENVYQTPHIATQVFERSSKRRRLEQNVENLDLVLNEVEVNEPSSPIFFSGRGITNSPVSTTHELQSNNLAMGPDVDIDEDDMNEDQADAEAGGIDVDKENQTPGIFKQVQKRRKRRSIGQQRRKQRERSSTSSMIEEAVDHTENADQDVQISENQTSVSDRAHSNSIEEQKAPDAESRGQKSGNIPQKKRKKRKSVILVRKKRKSSGREELSSIAGRSYQNETNEQDIQTPQPQPNDSIIVDDDEDPEEIANAQSPSHTNQTSFDMSELHYEPQIGTSPHRYRETDEDEDGDYVEEDHSPEPPTPMLRKKSRHQNLAGSQNDSTNTRSGQGVPARRRKKSGFPFITQRMANVETLPIIAEEPEVDTNSDNDANPFSGNFGDRSAPNSVDVLAQICRETIETNIDRMVNNTEEKMGAAERKRKRSALEAFGRELDGRLFEMSTAIESRITLESRVRKTRKEKMDLQNQWIEVRKKREQAALRCDALRRQHWENEETSKEQWRISEAAYRCEIELERSETGEVEGLEYLLRTVGALVSNDHGQDGGLLTRIKSFNMQLDRVANVLEGQNIARS